MRLWIEITIAAFAIGLIVGYTFNELNNFNARVNQVLAP